MDAALCTSVGNAAADGLKSVNDNIDGSSPAVLYSSIIIIMHCSSVMKWDEFRMQITVQCKKTRARTGSRLMSVSAPGRVSFFARYRPSPKIGKSRSPPGGVRLFGPLDRRSSQSLFTGRGSIWYSRSLYFFPSVYLFFFSFFIFHYTRYYYICSPATPFVSPLYFRAKGTTRSLRRARDASACI